MFGVAPAEIFPVEADGNANFQNAVVDPVLIQTGSLLHRDDWDIRGDDHRFASQPPAVDDIKNARSLPKLVFRSAPRSSSRNFFGLLKSELLYLQEFRSMEHFKLELIEYLDYYNNRRIKAKRKGLPPAIHRQQALSAA